MNKHLHIISLTVPYPVDYGGVFDLFYKLPALQEQGVKIHLHCFDYGRGEQPELNKFCESVHYYKRHKEGFLGKLPYIVSSRRNEDLFTRLLADNHPILMEGIHCTYLLTDDRFHNRKCFVRLHNVEHAYYYDLSRAAGSILKRIYFQRESRLLKRFELNIVNKAQVFSVTEKDARTYREEFHCKKIVHLPLFLPPWTVNAKTGIGAYCLYQGDLSVASNEKMAGWLVNVFSDLDISLKIAGKNPSKQLHRLCGKYENINLIADPLEGEMQELINNAHINIIPSFSNTGIKLKLLNALFNGRHCIVNNATVDGTGFEHLCHIANTTDHLKGLIAQLYYQPFREEEIIARKALLENHFNNAKNAATLTGMIFT